MTDASNWQAANERLRQRTQIERRKALRDNVGDEDVTDGMTLILIKNFLKFSNLICKVYFL